MPQYILDKIQDPVTFINIYLLDINILYVYCIYVCIYCVPLYQHKLIICLLKLREEGGERGGVR